MSSHSAQAIADQENEQRSEGQPEPPRRASCLGGSVRVRTWSTGRLPYSPLASALPLSAAASATPAFLRQQ
jgi:hypothetical protein